MADKIKKTTSKNPKTVVSGKAKKPAKTRVEEMKSTKAMKKAIGGKKQGSNCACSAG